MADNQLSGKLETAIQSLDNLTKVYHAFVNAKPVPGSPAVTPGHRYDSDLVPTSALDARQAAMQQHYAGISENIAGLIENILALKAAVKDVFLATTSTTKTTTSSNDTAFVMSRRAYVRRMLNVRRSTRLFQVLKRQNPLHQFPRIKSVTSWRGQKSVVSVVSCHFPNSITTCCGLVGRVANKSATSPWQVGNFPVYVEVTGKRV